MQIELQAWTDAAAVQIRLFAWLVGTPICPYRHNPWPDGGGGAMLPGCYGEQPGMTGSETFHELHDRIHVDSRPRLRRGMAGACRSRRLLSPRRQIRDDGPYL